MTAQMKKNELVWDTKTKRAIQKKRNTESEPTADAMKSSKDKKG